jgi:hypothetical protein
LAQHAGVAQQFGQGGFHFFRFLDPADHP